MEQLAQFSLTTSCDVLILILLLRGHGSIHCIQARRNHGRRALVYSYLYNLQGGIIPMYGIAEV
jgi:hypothetical protein